MEYNRGMKQIKDVQLLPGGSVNYRGRDGKPKLGQEPSIDDLMLMPEEIRSAVVHHVTGPRVPCWFEVDED